MDNLTILLARKLNQEMKNVVKKELTTSRKHDIINVSKQREVTKK